MVSVILPVYNRKNTVGRAIQSILDQTYKDIEIIVVDDGSSDGSVDVIRSFGDSRIKLIESGSNEGAAAARNRGLKNAQGDFIAFLDSDDKWMEDYIQKQINHMEMKGSDASFCAFSQCINGKSIIIPNEECRQNIRIKGVKKTLKSGNFIGTPTLMFRRNVIDEVGLFDEAIGCLEDFEYVLRISRWKDITFLNEVLVFVYTSGNSISGDDELHAKAYEYLSDKYAGYLDWGLLQEYIKRKCVSPENYTHETERFGLTVLNYLASMDSSDNRLKKAEMMADELFGLACEKEWNFQLYIKKLVDKKFYIYGAGIVALKVYKKLLKAGISPERFVITEKNDDDKELKIDGIEVISADLMQTDYPIIIAVSYKYQTEILDFLKDRGCTDCYVYSG